MADKGKGYTNPALAALGLRSVRLPSKNWMIFWTVLGVGLGGVAYDKYEQKQIRKRWMSSVEHLGQEPAPVGFLPRKIRVYVAPPPSDFLDESLKLFRRYVKPIINASGIDFEVYTEERVGDIRAGVADEIRKLRRARLGLSLPEETQEAPKVDLPKPSALRAPPIPRDEETKKVSELYTLTNLLGLRKWKPETTPYVSEDAQAANPADAGGVICVGRGAYKEYMLGVHEGLLGPLEPPAEPVTEVAEVAEVAEVPEVPEIPVVSDVKEEAIPLDVIAETPEKPEEKNEEKNEEKKEDEEEKRPPVPKPYILPKDYADAQVAPELKLNEHHLDANGVPLFIQQPVLVLRSYHLLGFLNSPIRIWRFYTKRWQAEEFAQKTSDLIYKRYRPMTVADAEQASEEEADWPSKWVKEAVERDNDWVREFKFDERVVSNMYIYTSKDK